MPFFQGFAAAAAAATDAELTGNKSAVAAQCQSYASAGLTHAADARYCRYGKRLLTGVI